MAELKRPIVWPDVPCDGEPSEFLQESWPKLYQDLAKMRKKAWSSQAKAYEKSPKNFYTAWWWLQRHPVLWHFRGDRHHESTLQWERGVDEGLEFRPVKVNPKTERIDDSKAKNTATRIWVEVFPCSMTSGRDGIRLHDYECDTGGATYESAVIRVAREIYSVHGHDRQALGDRWNGA